MAIVLVRVSIAMMKHQGQNQLGKERAHFILQLSGYTPSPREVREETKGGRYLKAVSGAEVMEEECLLACSSWLVQSAFL